VLRTQGTAARRTSVTAIDRESGATTVPITDAGYAFLVAGVSTCAPP
jgi:hypothetical protein